MHRRAAESKISPRLAGPFLCAPLPFDGPDHAWVGDPGAGKERWGLTNTRDLWVGDVLPLRPARGRAGG